jgi:transposase
VEIVHARCCGLDVHKKSVVECVLITKAGGLVERYVLTFKTMTADLVALDGWLSNQGVTHVALESTGDQRWRAVLGASLCGNGIPPAATS